MLSIYFLSAAQTIFHRKKTVSGSFEMAYVSEQIVLFEIICDCIDTGR